MLFIMQLLQLLSLYFRKTINFLYEKKKTELFQNVLGAEHF